LAGGERNIVVEAPTGLGKGPDAVSPKPLGGLRGGIPGILSPSRIRAPG